MSKKPLPQDRKDECLRLKAIFNSKKHELGLTQEKLAHALEMNQSSVSHYLNGVNALNASVAASFAEILRIDVRAFSERLASEIARMTQALDRDGTDGGASVNTSSHSLSSIRLNSRTLNTVPLISLKKAREWISVGHKVTNFEIEAELPCPIAVGPRAFAFRMPNDSMAGGRSDNSILEGWSVFIDPDAIPKAGQIVLASIDGRDPILGILTEHGGRTYVIPSNPQFDKEQIGPNDAEWCLGRAIFVGFSV